MASSPSASAILIAAAVSCARLKAGRGPRAGCSGRIQTLSILRTPYRVGYDQDSKLGTPYSVMARRSVRGVPRVPSTVAAGAVRLPRAVGRRAGLADQAGGAGRARRAGGVRARLGRVRPAEAGPARDAERGGGRLPVRAGAGRPALARQGLRPL